MHDLIKVLRNRQTTEMEIPVDESKRLVKEQVFKELTSLPREERYPKYQEYQLSNGYMAPPHDNRFPQVDKKRSCYFNYMEYHRCYKVFGEEHVPCEYFKWAYRSMCPTAWHEKWDQHRTDDVFAGQWWIDSGKNIPRK